MKNETFSEISTSIKIIKTTRKGHFQELSFENEMKSTPLNYKADFVPSKTCRVIIIEKEKLGFRIIDSSIERIEKSIKIKIVDGNDGTNVETPGTLTEMKSILNNFIFLVLGSLLQCESEDLKFYTMGMYLQNSLSFKFIEPKNVPKRTN